MATDVEELRRVLKSDIQALLKEEFQRQEQTLRNMMTGVASPAKTQAPPQPEPLKASLAPAWDSKRDYQPPKDLYEHIEPPAYELTAGEQASQRKLSFGGFGAARKLLDGNRENLDQKRYNVMDHYHESGWFQHVARSDWFNDFTLFIISANAVYLGVNSELNSDANSILDSPMAFVLSENVFCFYFTWEISVRFGAFKYKMDSFRDNWFRFDFCLVALMVAETWVLPVIMLSTGQTLNGFPTAPLRLLRLLRLSRLVRLMRSLPELVTMTKGMVCASRAVASSLLMILMLIYVCAIVLHMFLKDHVELSHKFETLPKCMWTLFMDGTLMDGTGGVVTVLLYEWTPAAVTSVMVFLVFILLSSMTVMNMLIGVLCEVVSAVAQDERDEAAITLMKETILVQLLRFDEDNSGTIDRDEFAEAMRNKQCLQVLHSLEVDLDCLRDLQMILFPDDTTEVRIDEIMDILLQYRGGVAPTVRHLVEMMSFTRWYLAAGMRVLHERMDHKLQDLDAMNRAGLQAFTQMCELATQRSTAGLAQPCVAQIEAPKQPAEEVQETAINGTDPTHPVTRHAL